MAAVGSGCGGYRELLYQSVHSGEGTESKARSSYASGVPGRGPEGELMFDRRDLSLIRNQRVEEKPSFTFWTTLAKSFETQTKEAARCEFSINGCLDYDLPPSLSFRLAATGSERWLSQVAEVVSRLFRQNRRAHGYSIHTRTSKVRSIRTTNFVKY